MCDNSFTVVICPGLRAMNSNHTPARIFYGDEQSLSFKMVTVRKWGQKRIYIVVKEKQVHSMF